MLDKIDTLEKARNYTFRNTGHTQGIHGTVALGQYCFNRKESDESKNAFEVFFLLFHNLNTLFFLSFPHLNIF